MDKIKLSNVSLIVVKDHDVLRPYSSILEDSVSRLNELSSLIRDNSVLVCDKAHQHLSFLLSSPRILLYTCEVVDSRDLDPKVKCINCVDDIHQLLRRKYDACYILGGGEVFKAFSSLADRMYLTDSNDCRCDKEETVCLSLSDWKQAKQNSYPFNNFMYFKEFFRENKIQEASFCEPNIFCRSPLS